jgi:DNA-directed RNA polymerase I and III subunit RPAC1
VYSRDLRWVPQEEQRELFEPDEIRPVHPDILLLRMRPGQCVRLKAFAQKGIGRTHAKWSPVATASYRLLPEVTIRGEVRGEAARTLVDACPMGVFDLEDVAGTVRAKVSTPPRPLTSRLVSSLSPSRLRSGGSAAQLHDVPRVFAGAGA